MKLGYFEKGFIKESEIMMVTLGIYHQEQWLFIQYSGKSTWELLGGPIKAGESPEQAAKRVLLTELGETDYKLYSILDYTVTADHKTSCGRLYCASVQNILPSALGADINALSHSQEFPQNPTQPFIHPHLHKILEKFQKEL